MRKFLKKKQLSLKNRTLNIFMKNGKKTMVEKNLLKFVKRLQKSNNKKFTLLFQSAIINTTPVFSVNTQVIKKGKKKVIKDVPSFLFNHFARVSSSVKFFKESVTKEKKTGPFYEVFAKEVFNSSVTNSISSTKKFDLQNKLLSNKRYWSNFKW